MKLGVAKQQQLICPTNGWMQDQALIRYDGPPEQLLHNDHNFRDLIYLFQREEVKEREHKQGGDMGEREKQTPC